MASLSVFWTQVDHALGLADRALDASALYNTHLGGHADQRLDLLRGIGRTPGQAAYLARDHRKAAPRFARARRLDGGIERQQIGLARDRLNQPDDSR